MKISPPIIGTMALKGKLALVTGSTTKNGIGLSILHALAGAGCDVIVTGLGEQSTINEIVESIKSKHGVNAEFIGADLRKVEEIRSLTSQLLQKHPDGVDILINNAGVDGVYLVEDCPDELWDSMVAIHMSAPFHLIKILLPYMRKKGWGRIVNTSSVLGFVSAARQAAYSATKHGMIGLTKGVALETAETGVTCNAVCPGVVMTQLVADAVVALSKIKNISLKEQEEDFLKLVPTKQFLTPEKVADFVLYLVSSVASDQITGAAHLIDGGYTAW